MTAAQLDLDLADAAFVDDPFPLYEEIRTAGRVVWNPGVEGWMVTGYDDCLEVLSDTQGPRFATVGARRPEVTFWFDAPNMIIADGADHRRLRQGVSRHFTVHAIAERWEPRVREVVEAVLAPLTAGGRASVDLGAEFTRVPVVILAEMLGIPEDRQEALRRWSMTVVSNVAYGHEHPEGRRAMDDTVAELSAYMSQEIARHRREPLDDLLTVMMAMPDWSEAEVRSSAINLLLAGYDTTARLMAECLVTLERHPDQRRLVAERLVLVPNVVEEVLRWAGGSQCVAREVVRDTELAGQALRAGEIVYLLLAAANRDPSRWEQPERFDVEREFRPHLGFGAGPHFCLSAPLARLETRMAVETLLRIAPEYRLREVAYGGSFFTRGPQSGIIQAGRRSP